MWLRTSGSPSDADCPTGGWALVRVHPPTSIRESGTVRYSHGNFTVLTYSCHVLPNSCDSWASSAGAKIRDPAYSVIPTTTPSHVLQRKPAHGSTRSATLV